MKKIITAIAACAFVGMLSAEVVSSNIVGYTTLNTTAGKKDIMGVQFQNVGGGSLSIQDIVPVSGFSDGVDSIRIWNAATESYVYAYYFSVTYEDDSCETVLGAGWADTDQIRVDYTIEAGQGFWLTTRANASCTVAGEVVAAEDNELSTAAFKKDIVCNTFPVAGSIQDIVPVSGFSTDGMDLIRIWNAATESYVYAYYFSETYDDSYETELGAGWADGNGVKVDYTLEAGQSFWLTTSGNAVVSFTPPAGL